MKLKHDTWVVVADGRKFLILRNNGDTEFTDLRVMNKTEVENPPTREQGTDRPGRMPDDGQSGRSAMSETDWHELEERRFAAELGHKLHDWAAKKRYTDLVVIADPRTLGNLRDEYTKEVKSRLIHEIDRDYTGHTVTDIEAALNAAKPAG